MEEQKGTFKNILLIIILLLAIGGLVFYFVTGKNILGSIVNKDTFTKLDSEYVLIYEDVDIPGLSYQIHIDNDINISVSNFSGCEEDEENCDNANADDIDDNANADDIDDVDDVEDVDDDYEDDEDYDDEEDYDDDYDDDEDYYDEDYEEEPEEKKQEPEFKEESYTLEFSGIKKALIKMIYIHKIFGKEKVKRISDYIEDSYTQNFIDAVLLKNDKYIKLW